MRFLKKIGEIFKMALVDNPLFEAYNEDAKARREKSERQRKEAEEREYRAQVLEALRNRSRDGS